MLNRRDRVAAKRESNVIELRPQHPVSCKANIPLMLLAYSLGLIGLAINAWFTWNNGSSLIDKSLMSSLGFTTEAMAFFLPALAASLWNQRRIVASLSTWALFAFLFTSALMNGLGFASTNLTETTTAKAERITPAVADAQRRLDSLSVSRKDECQKRGEKCRQLEKDEQLAFESLRVERDTVSAIADPQIVSAAKMAAWLSFGIYHPSADDFAMIKLLILTLLPQLGGLVLMVSSRR